MEDKLIDTTDFVYVSPIFKGERGQRFASVVMKLFKIDLVNALYDRSADCTGSEFAASILKDLGVEYLIGNADRLNQLKDGVFITVSNHPYGGLDGIMLIDMMATIRSDYKLMVNQILSKVKTMDENFISVNPRVGKNKPNPISNINGIRETLAHVKKGHPFGFFPAGAVSMFRFKNMRVRDREWQESILKLIQKTKLPVVPIRFFDTNSLFFYFLGLINWRIRQLRMPYELFNKKGLKTRLAIGNIITTQELNKFTTSKSLGKYLYRAIYDMPIPKIFISINDLKYQKQT